MIDGAPTVTIPSAEVSACDLVSSCPPILKEIDFEGGAPQTISIHEEWIVGPGPEWWDWHEVILQSPP